MKFSADVSEIKYIMNKYGFTFKKGLGQNFLYDEQTLEKIAAAGKSDGVIEIGPGFGSLTRILARNYEKVVSIEADDRLIPILGDILAEYDNVRIIHNDCMKVNFPELIETEFSGKSVSVAANLPYYITTPIISMLLENKLPLKKIVITVQKEVADRIAAAPGGKEYGAFSVMCQYYSKPKIIAKIPASLFTPPPKVDSAAVLLEVCAVPNVSTVSEKMFFKTVRAAFAQRRKTLLNALANGSFGISKNDIGDILTDAGINPAARGETLSLEEFSAIADRIYSRTEITK